MTEEDLQRIRGFRLMRDKGANFDIQAYMTKGGERMTDKFARRIYKAVNQNGDVYG